VSAGPPPIPRRAQEAKAGRRKRSGTIGGSGAHFIQVKAEFGDVFTHEEYAAFQTKFRDFDTMGGAQSPSGTVDFVSLKWAQEKMGDPKTDQELKDIMDEMASIHGKRGNYEIGFSYRDFIILQCKLQSKTLPASITDTFDQAAWSATLNFSTNFISSVNDYAVSSIRSMHEHNALEAQKEKQREVEIRRQAKERAEYKRKKKAEDERRAKAEAAEKERLEKEAREKAEALKARREKFAHERAHMFGGGASAPANASPPVRRQRQRTKTGELVQHAPPPRAAKVSDMWQKRQEAALAEAATTPKMEVISVVAPAGTPVGGAVRVRTPTGDFAAVVPQGVSEGQEFPVMVPAAAAASKSTEEVTQELLEGPSEIYYEMDDDQSDSIDQGQLKALVEAGDLSDQSRVWCTGLDDWTPLGECKFLFPALDGVDSTYLNHKSLFYSTGDDDGDNVEVTIAAFRALLLASGEQGGVTSSTKVWAEGMDEWVEYSSVEHMFSAGGAGGAGGDGGETLEIYFEAAADTAAEAAVSTVELKALLDGGKLHAGMETHVWVEGMDGWEPLSHVADQFAPFAAAAAGGGGSVPLIAYYEVAEDEPSDAVGIDAFKLAVEQGTITPSTKVWADGMDEWLPLSECRSAFGLEGAEEGVPPAA
jgi:hypothetical protein